jgi:hypothetical protein
MGLEITAKIFISLPEGQGCGSGSGSRRAKMTHKKRKKYRIFMF